MTIPGDMMESTMTVDCFAYSDTSGIYAYFRYKDISATICSNKIPWTTSQWEYYRAYTMQFDRQAMQNNIDMTNRDMTNGLIDSAANGIIGGTIGGAVSGGGLIGAGVGAATGISSFASGAISANIKREQQIMKLQKEQQLTEQRMRNQPGSATNTTYGAGYIMKLGVFDGAQFILEMPSGFTATDFSSQTTKWGYPSNKVLQLAISLTTGYWKGMITSIGANHVLNYFDSFPILTEMIIDDFNNGVRLIQIN